MSDKKPADDPGQKDTSQDPRTERADLSDQPANTSNREGDAESPHTERGGLSEQPTIRPGRSGSSDDEHTYHSTELVKPSGEQGDLSDQPTTRPTGPPDATHRPSSDQLSRTEGMGDAAYVPSPQKLPKSIGEFDLLDEIGKGGMGIVFKARQRSLDRIVAVKMITEGTAADDAEILRFQREARSVGMLEHPGIVPVYAAGTEQGYHYFAMAYVDGENLAVTLRRCKKLPQIKSAKLALEIAEAMSYAHDKGVIHRDLKPANVMMDKEGRPRITDFGLVKRIPLESGEGSAIVSLDNLTVDGQVMGTPQYMSPEQARGEKGVLGKTTDVYSMGGILGTLLLGRPPFRSVDPNTPAPIPLRQQDASISKDLEAVFLKCCETDPSKRYADAGALAQDLQNYLAGLPVTARPLKGMEKSLRWCRNNPALAALIAVSLVLLGALLAIVIWLAQND